MQKIVPAILSTDIQEVQEKVNAVAPFSGWVHIDIMDNIFVKNSTILIEEINKLKGEINIEAHLMVENPEDYFKKCQKSLCKRVIVHIEALEYIENTIKDLK